MARRIITGRKRLGQFFTPAFEAEILASWVVRCSTDRILEPSVGDGALLFAALRHAKSLPGRFGLTAVACDVDKSVISALRDKVESSVQLQQTDFLELDPATVRPVDAVVANPPFTRNHQLSLTRRKALRSRYRLKGAAGLWAYFVLHARRFLRPGGRMAFVVPGAATFTEYGADLLSQLQPDFQSISLLEFSTKPEWIGNADERGVLLLVDGYQKGPATKVDRGIWRQDAMAAPSLRASATPSFEKLAAQSHPLSSIADLSIGVVTGRNAVFLMTDSEVQECGVSYADLSPVVSRARHARGLYVSKHDLRALAEQGQKTWLLTPEALGRRGSPVRRRLAQINAEERAKILWLNKRTPWWKVELGAECDAVFTYMNDLGPRLALAEAGIYCTNTLHRVTFKKGVATSEKHAALLTFLSTFGQLFAEGLGRGYGGGLLKFELREARAFPILQPSSLVTAPVVSAIDAMLREGDLVGASFLADKTLLSPFLGSSWKSAVDEMRLILESTRLSRRRGDARLFSIGRP